MNKIFYLCVELLEWMVVKLNTTYEAINVWIFCVLGPIVFMIMLWTIYIQYHIIKGLKQGLISP